MVRMTYTVDPRSFLEVTLREFFEEDDNMQVMTKIIKNDMMSLRTLDWFISNYSKKNNIMFTTPTGKLFNIFMEYKSQLKSYSKRMFDSFNRGDRIICKDHKGIEFSTTIGQLNFFRWVIKNDLINECMKHIDDVETDMAMSMKQRKNSIGPDSKRKELSKAAIKSCQYIYTNVVVTFS
jgi:hypothetical protein